ncbi:cytosolic endo-beta-n-acetylglucosaminidase [Lasius niger]|uniref:Cytosolic endo-beta-n-acetylglucosaminidase n=1 Tax=Lasius niger TaxID=67767 RepID=A0A0J7L379_LASNI|nr:cytosolic endo-beta-n-acetylglucosaminidase [Lasius niger]
MANSTEVRELLPFKTLAELYNALDNGLPELPITYITESVDYVYRGSDISAQQISLEKVDRDEQPRTLVCHDMKGGYLEDSHHFVTIPPCGWINTAHHHGVKVLGTIITEGNNDTWNTILASQEDAKKFADTLVLIAKCYQFEGWLLNIENKIKQEDIDNLIYFVNYLTENIHKEIENSEIIWYDSVTNKGELNWQNELNENNKEFFLHCDGIFLNYNWTESKLGNSCMFAKELGRDIKDIYVGLDVWGRGCPGGGGFNSAYALDLIRKQGLSVAIFAPGWTHEYFGPSTFQVLEDLFWAQLFPYLYVHVSIYEDETFKTSFCRGAGICYYYNGEQPQLTVSAPHSQFTRSTQTTFIEDVENDDEVNNGQGDKDNDTKKPRTRIERIYENRKNIIRVCDNVVNFEEKLPALDVNTFEFCDQFSYNGGGCLKLITRDHRLYHRLFLIHIDLKHNIQATIVYTELGTLMNESRKDPVLILGNNGDLKSILPYDSVRVNAKWRKCIYLTNLRTVDEIGVSFLGKCECYLGEIVLGKRDHRFGIVLVVFGVLVLVHGASLGGSGAGLWAGAGALVAGALGVVATLATSSTKTNSAFASAHLASSLIALALSNMAAITALTAVVRDSQRASEVSFLNLSDDDSDVVEVDGGLAGLLASIGLLVASVAELLVSGYSCLTLTPKLCGCLRTNVTDETVSDGHLKTRNMVHQWVIAQNHVPAKNQQTPIYVVQPMPVPMHPMIQPPYGMPPPAPGKFPLGAFVPAGSLSISTPTTYGALPVLSHMPPYVGRPPSQLFRPKHKRQPLTDQEELETKRQIEIKNESLKRMSSIGEDQVDLAQTYTGLDKRISEEFISIAMDPDRKSKASSHYGSEIGTAKTF